jgi:uncharacterized protein (DUF1778 family)
MATLEIIGINSPYYDLRINIDGVNYDQTISSDLKGMALADFVLDYAQKYASEIALLHQLPDELINWNAEAMKAFIEQVPAPLEKVGFMQKLFGG